MKVLHVLRVFESEEQARRSVNNTSLELGFLVESTLMERLEEFFHHVFSERYPVPELVFIHSDSLIADNWERFKRLNAKVVFIDEKIASVSGFRGISLSPATTTVIAPMDQTRFMHAFRDILKNTSS